MSESGKNNSILNALTNLGLGENEANLYILLLKIPEASIPELVKRSDFSRTMLYHVLGNLKNAGLITEYKKGKKTVYNAEPPEKLEDFILAQERELKRQRNLLTDVSVDLRSLYRLGHNKPGVKFFEGKEGSKEALYDTLTATETVYAYVDLDAVQSYGDDINIPYVKKRRQLGIHKKLLVIDTPSARDYLKRQGSEMTEFRFLPKEMGYFATGMEIYNNKISYFTLNETDGMAVIIEDHGIYQMHRKMFEFLWQMQDKKTIAVGDGGSGTVFN